MHKHVLTFYSFVNSLSLSISILPSLHFLLCVFWFQGTTVIPNLSSVMNEESQWKFPHDFNPSNFLNDEGEFVKPEAFIPFSAG